MPTEQLSRIVFHSSRRLLQVGGYRSQFVQTALGKVHYYQARGSGPLPPMVFVHGMGAHAADLYPLFRRLRRYAQAIIAVDLPAHGWSDVPQPEVSSDNLNRMFCEALDQILSGGPPALLFGNSLGGLAVIRYCRHRPGQVAQLVLSSPGGAALSEGQMQKLQGIFAHETQHTPASFLARLYNQPPALGWLVAREVQLRFRQPGLQAVIQTFDPENLLRPEDLQQLQVPTLMIWGQQDRILEDQVHFFRDHLPAHAHILEPSHFTHCPYMEMPEELALQIRNFARLHGRPAVREA